MPDVRKRVRLAGATVAIQAYLDDGDSLELIPVQPIQCSLEELKGIDLEAIAATLQRQVDAQANGAEAPQPSLGG